MDLHLTDEQAGLLLALALIVAAPIATDAQTTEPPPEPRSMSAIAQGNEQMRKRHAQLRSARRRPAGGAVSA